MQKKNIKIAIVQDRPKHLNLSACMDQAKQRIEEAAAANAQIVVFAELWLPGYPSWIDFCLKLGNWDDEHIKTAWAKLYQNSLEITGKEMQQLQQLAKENSILLVMGFHEVIKSGKGNSSIYNSFVIIDEEGKILNHHRKLMPTFNEKLLHALGDAAGLKTVDTSCGRLGALICWEHWMPLSRQALHDDGEDIHFALWPQIKERHLLASKHYAFEGRCYVIAVGQLQKLKDTPANLSLPEEMTDPELLTLDGGSCVIGPNGQYLLEPQYGDAKIYYVDLPPLENLIKERMNLSISGHYQRYDIFNLTVDKSRKF